MNTVITCANNGGDELILDHSIDDDGDVELEVMGGVLYLNADGRKTLRDALDLIDNPPAPRVFFRGDHPSQQSETYSTLIGRDHSKKWVFLHSNEGDRATVMHFSAGEARALGEAILREADKAASA